MLQGLINDFERTRQQRELAAIKANPRAHRNTMIWSEKGLRWRYFEAKNGRGQTVHFCWSTTRNAAGWFCTWREVHYKNGTAKRFDFRFRKSRKRCREIAEARRQKALAS